MPDFFTVDSAGKPIPATPDHPTILRHLSGESIVLHDAREGHEDETILTPGESVTLTAPQSASSDGANVSMERG